MMTLSVRKKLLAKIVQTIRGNKTFFLSGHQKPDGDTVASELAFGSLLKRLKKKVDIYNAEPVPPSLMFLPGAGTIKTSAKVDKHYDVAVIFECFDQARMGNVIELKKQANVVINIDHHMHHSFFGDINFINPKASSNSEQLVYVFEALKMPITKGEANCLYTGLSTDTGRFQHSNTTAETFRIASILTARGAEPHIISERVFTTSSQGGLKLLGHCLATLKTIENEQIAYTSISKEDFNRLGATEDEIEDIVNYGLQIPTALISILTRESQNGSGVKVSLRARRGVDVCKVAQSFGGGGHKYAAGCKIKGPLPEVTAQLLQAAKSALK